MIHVWVRSTVDWADDEAVRAQLPANVAPAVALWDATFTLPFHAFRHRVRQIAQRNHERMRGATVSIWDDIPDGALVLPVDDDDWFAPEIAAALEASAGDGVAGIRWRASYFELPTNRGHAFDIWRRRILPRWPTQWLCVTNNYAVVKGPGMRPLAESHLKASAWVSSRPPRELRWVEQRLSAMNRTLGSTTTLMSTRADRDALLAKHRRYCAIYRRSVSRELAWARPYLADMAALMDELAVRR